MTSRTYQAVDEHVATAILAIHKKHPKLGQRGIDRALKQSSVHVDPNDLTKFLRKHHIQPERDSSRWRVGWLPSWLPFAGPATSYTDRGATGDFGDALDSD